MKKYNNMEKAYMKKQFWHHVTDCKTGYNCEFRYKKVDRVNVGSEVGYIEVGQLIGLIQLFYKQGL